MSVRPLSLPSDPSSGATSPIWKITRGRPKNRKSSRAQGESYRRAPTIGVLPDNILLEIFDFCQKNHDTLRPVWNWHLLIHVCRRWRQITFASPHRLNLQILCTQRTPVRKYLGIWPACPIVIDGGYIWGRIRPNDEDNVVAALEHPDRVCYLRLHVTGSQLGKLALVMQEPFPVLTHLWISSKDGYAPVLSGRSFGGSAPCLQKIYLRGIPYPTLPALLMSASDLVKLHLRDIPPTGYFSPHVMVACLAVLPSLKDFTVEFHSATPRPDQIPLPPVTRAVLPALTYFEFRGASEYLEDFVARIDSPQVNEIVISYLNQLVGFQVARLSEFVHRSVGPELALFSHAHISFFGDKVSFDMYRHANHPPHGPHPVRTIISCEGTDWQVSHMSQMLSHFSATLSTVVHLKLKVRLEEVRQLESAGDAEWLHLLHQFLAVQTLHVSLDLARHVARALEDVAGEMVTGVLPSLGLIYLAGEPASSIEKFVAARRLSGHPIIIIDTEIEFERLDSYVGK